MKSMNRREGKKIAVMAAIIMGLMMFAFMPLASATVTSFTVTPSTGIAGAVDSYNALVTTDGVTSINITIPAGFIGVVPMSGGVELVRIDFWNSSTKAYYGYVTFTANDTNPTTKIDAYCELGGVTARTTQTVNYTPGATNTFVSNVGGDTSSVITKLPTESLDGSINITINCTAFYLDDVMLAIGQFVRNPLTASDYLFFADGVMEVVTITATPGGRSAVYRGRTWYVDTNGDRLADICFDYGQPDDEPLFGDLNRDGSNDAIVYRGRTWYVDTDGDGVSDLWYNFGLANDKPLVGDFNRDGRDDIAVYRGRTWYINTALGASGEKGVDLWYNFGLANDKPLVGDFNRDGRDDIAVYRGRTWYINTALGASGEKGVDLWYNFGLAGDIPLVGDITMDDGTDIAVYRGCTWYVSTNLGISGEKGVDLSFNYGLDGDTPLVGDYYG